MPNRLHSLFGSVSLATLLALSGCGGSSKSPVKPAAIDSDAGQKAVAQFDANKDGVLDYKELDKAPGLKAAVAQIKKLGGGPRGAAPSASDLQAAKISADEINVRVTEWKNAGTGRISINCRVTRKGKPVDGATVQFVPESFQGTALGTGSGTTNASGSANVIMPSRGGDDPAIGMCPGFYRVEITKGSEIPAKYNTATTLGQEVARDAAGVFGGQVEFKID